MAGAPRRPEFKISENTVENFKNFEQRFNDYAYQAEFRNFSKDVGTIKHYVKLLKYSVSCPHSIVSTVYSCDHDRRAAIDTSVAIALVPGISQAAIAVDKSRDSSRQKPR